LERLQEACQQSTHLTRAAWLRTCGLRARHEHLALLVELLKLLRRRLDALLVDVGAYDVLEVLEQARVVLAVAFGLHQRDLLDLALHVHRHSCAQCLPSIVELQEACLPHAACYCMWFRV
jgi:hypothetical protein